MDKWNEFRTAYMVAKHGTVTAASEALGVHRATVIRHIDALEDSLGGKIFFRNARGYSLTEIGEDLLRVAETTEDQFKQFMGRSDTRGPGVSGELIVSTVDVICHTFSGAMDHFLTENSDATIRSLVTTKALKLEYGEAHVAIRAGKKPDDPDYVVLPLAPLETGLYAHQSYLDTHGPIDSIEALARLRYVGIRVSKPIGPYAWLEKHLPSVDYCFLSENFHCRLQAIVAGVGAGFMPVSQAAVLKDVILLQPPNRALNTRLWLVTHGATHRSAKVQAFIASLRETGHMKPLTQ
ncbi:MAG: LysR family transcriptional regulator [Pseudomonadota bacterium]